MKNMEPMVLLPQFVDRAGATVCNLHSWPKGRKTPGTVADTPVLGQVRINLEDDQEPVKYEPAVVAHGTG